MSRPVELCVFLSLFVFIPRVGEDDRGHEDRVNSPEYQQVISVSQAPVEPVAESLVLQCEALCSGDQQYCGNERSEKAKRDGLWQQVEKVDGLDDCSVGDARERETHVSTSSENGVGETAKRMATETRFPLHDRSCAIPVVPVALKRDVEFRLAQQYRDCSIR